VDPSLVLNLGLGEGTERILVLMVSRASEVLEGRSTSVTVSFKGWSTKIVDLSPSPPPQLKVHFDEPPKSSFDDPRTPVLLSWPSNSSDKQSTVLHLYLGSQYSMSEQKVPYQIASGALMMISFLLCFATILQGQLIPVLGGRGG
jgi:hypothetical protein